MKTSIYFKFFIYYILCVILSIILIETIIKDYFTDYNIKQKAKELYDTANEISSLYDSYLDDTDTTGTVVQAVLQEFSSASDYEIRIVNNNKSIIFSSKLRLIGSYMLKFDSAFFDGSYYKIGNLYGELPDNSLCVITTHVRNYSEYTYVLINYDYNLINDNIAKQINLIYLEAALIFIVFLLFVFAFSFTVYRPITKISKATREYAKGNFSYPAININSHDELKRLSNSINFMVSEVNGLENDQKKFIANISHDFRSPLTSIRGYAEAMLDGTVPPELYEKYLNIILAESDRLKKLTSNLLTLNTWDSRSTHLTFSSFDINKLIKTTLSSFEGQCVKKSLQINLTFAAKEYYVTADNTKIGQVIYNLVDNAIKFSDVNSHIDIDVASKNEKVFISIKDFGCGIPKSSLNKIWERFYKSDSSRGKDKSGTGLGLSIVKEIITSHNENINVISTEGVGTEFIFTLAKTKKA